MTMKSLFFFEKKKQKTFATWHARPGKRTHKKAKVFLLLFLQKKKTLPSGAIS
jgi:hypothetical protein